MHALNLKLLVAIFLTLIIAGCSQQSAESGSASMMDSGIINLKNPEKHIYTGGQPTKEQLKKAADAGVKHIINLRPKAEQSFDEAAEVATLGMTYHHIPVAGAAGVTEANAKQLQAMLAGIDDESVLIHCASSNRVGALAALMEAQKSSDLEQSIATGKAWGMTSLQGKVRSVLTN